MSKYHAGDKFVITVAEVFEGSNTLYRIKGFHTCIFDAKGLDKLDALREEETESFLQAKYNEGYNKGLKDMYMTMLWSARNNYSDSITWAKRIDKLTPQYILEAYKKDVADKVSKGIKGYLQENLIEVGCEVRIDYPSGTQYGIVTKIYKNAGIEYIVVLMQDGDNEYFEMDEVEKYIFKTGKMYRIEEILSELNKKEKE